MMEAYEHDLNNKYRQEEIRARGLEFFRSDTEEHFENIRRVLHRINELKAYHEDSFDCDLDDEYKELLNKIGLKEI